MTIRAARYSGTIKPWELEQMPLVWRERLLMAESGEREAERKNREQAEREQARRGPRRGTGRRR